MTDISLPRMRQMCDQIQGASRCRSLSWLTEFNVDKSRRAWVLAKAKLALDSYNQKEQKNFNLENLCKLNRMNRYYCMTFRARNAETDECRLFRGLVSAVGNDVMLCEIKDGDTLGGYIAVRSQSKEAHSPYTRTWQLQYWAFHGPFYPAVSKPVRKEHADIFSILIHFPDALSFESRPRNQEN